MMANRARQRAKRAKPETYVVTIERSAFGYSVNAAFGSDGYAQAPEHMSLKLWGRFLQPAGKLRGAAVEVTVMADRDLLATFKTDRNAKTLGLVDKGGTAKSWRVWAGAPHDVVPHLARGAATGELDLAVAVGDPLFRNRASIWFIGLQTRATFEADWGVPLHA